ncbi:Hypothetical predicted protein [Cloeon dipterum]|uniref:Uncharacterized protein n=1 Tax=Cloeon dipterum TaxID=197152 RepID=A0A8S1DYT4_9INSE|nr:Hypothetical predicted protein [Cloeon dipterum]
MSDDSSFYSRPWSQEQFYLQPPIPTTGKMPFMVNIDSEEALKRYHATNTPLNPYFYPASCVYNSQYNYGYYDSANRRGLFVYKLDNGENVRVTRFDNNFVLLCDQENLLEWRPYQHGDLESQRVFRVPTHRNGKYVYFGRVRQGKINLVGQVCEDGICYVPTLLYGVIRVSDFETLMYRDVQQCSF